MPAMMLSHEDGWPDIAATGDDLPAKSHLVDENEKSAVRIPRSFLKLTVLVGSETSDRAEEVGERHNPRKSRKRLDGDAPAGLLNGIFHDDSGKMDTFFGAALRKRCDGEWYINLGPGPQPEKMAEARQTHNPAIRDAHVFRTRRLDIGDTSACVSLVSAARVNVSRLLPASHCWSISVRGTQQETT